MQQISEGWAEAGAPPKEVLCRASRICRGLYLSIPQLRFSLSPLLGLAGSLEEDASWSKTTGLHASLRPVSLIALVSWSLYFIIQFFGVILILITLDVLFNDLSSKIWYFLLFFSEVKARTECPKCPTPQTMLPRHLILTHGVDPSEVDSLLPPTFRRRTKSAQADDDDEEDDEDEDAPEAVWAAAEDGPDQDEESEHGDDPVVGGGQVGFGAPPLDPDDPIYDLYQQQQAQAQGAQALQQQQPQPQAAPVVVPILPQQRQPQGVIRPEDLEAAMRAIHEGGAAGITPGVQQAAAAATDKSAKPTKKSVTR